MKKLILLFIHLILVSHLYSQNQTTDNINISVEKIPPVSSENELNPVFIKKRQELLVGNSLQKLCKEKNIKYPPEYILFRAFKQEQEFEIWAGKSKNDSLKHLATFSICAADFIPGPKLKEGDGKTPEGFYNCTLHYYGGSWFMWTKLDSEKINDEGAENKGSCYKIYLDYPSAADYFRTNTVYKNTSPGSAIFIHGNCVSIGCLSFKNYIYCSIFLLASYHNFQKFGNIQIHIFPFRFSNCSIESQLTKSNTDLTNENLVKFWKNLQEGYLLFEKNHKPLSISIYQDKYIFR